MKKCENCESQHDGSYASGRFCSSKCARCFSTKKNRAEINRRVSLTLSGSYTGKDNSFYKANPDYIRPTRECLICKTSFETIQSSNKVYCSPKCARKGQVTPTGGYRPGSGRGKSGWYKGYWCDSSWELAWVIYHLDHNIEFVRSKTYFNYTFNDKTLRYYPDFVINDTFIEIKGYRSPQYEAKLKQLPSDVKIIVLYREDLKDIFKYVTTKYGTDYVKLYEGNPHNDKKNLCKICGCACKKTYCSRICTGKALVKHKWSVGQAG